MKNTRNEKKEKQSKAKKYVALLVSLAITVSCFSGFSVLAENTETTEPINTGQNVETGEYTVSDDGQLVPVEESQDVQPQIESIDEKESNGEVTPIDINLAVLRSGMGETSFATLAATETINLPGNSSKNPYTGVYNGDVVINTTGGGLCFQDVTINGNIRCIATDEGYVGLDFIGGENTINGQISFDSYYSDFSVEENTILTVEELCLNGPWTLSGCNEGTINITGDKPMEIWNDYGKDIDWYNKGTINAKNPAVDAGWDGVFEYYTSNKGTKLEWALEEGAAVVIKYSDGTVEVGGDVRKVASNQMTDGGETVFYTSTDSNVTVSSSSKGYYYNFVDFKGSIDLTNGGKCYLYGDCNIENLTFGNNSTVYVRGNATIKKVSGTVKTSDYDIYVENGSLDYRADVAGGVCASIILNHNYYNLSGSRLYLGGKENDYVKNPYVNNIRNQGTIIIPSQSVLTANGTVENVKGYGTIITNYNGAIVGEAKNILNNKSSIMIKQPPITGDYSSCSFKLGTADELYFEDFKAKELSCGNSDTPIHFDGDNSIETVTTIGDTEINGSLISNKYIYSGNMQVKGSLDSGIGVASSSETSNLYIQSGANLNISNSIEFMADNAILNVHREKDSIVSDNGTYLIKDTDTGNNILNWYGSTNGLTRQAGSTCQINVYDDTTITGINADFEKRFTSSGGNYYGYVYLNKSNNRINAEINSNDGRWTGYSGANDIIYTSEDGKIASVSTDGTITGKSLGQTYIKCKPKANQSTTNNIGLCVEVCEPMIGSNKNISAKNNTETTVDISDAVTGGTEQEHTLSNINMPSGVTYSISGTELAITPNVPAGEYDYSVDVNDTGIEGEKVTISGKLKVDKGVPEFTVPKQINVEYGKTTAVNASINSNGALTYASNNTDIINVNKNTGVITPVRAGTTTVTVTAAATDYYTSDSVTIPVTVAAAAPGTPTSAEITNIMGTYMDLSWRTPANNGGADITGYDIKVYTDAAHQNQVTAAKVENLQMSSALNTATISGLSKKTTYYITIAANNGTKSSATPAALSGTTYTNPDAPQNVKASENTPNTLKVTWETPESTGGKDITGYTVNVYDKAEGGSVVVTKTVYSSDRAATITGLQLNKNYYADVTATTAVGSAVSSPRVAITAPSAPVNVAAGVSDGDGNTSVTVTWDEANTNNSAITGYSVKYRVKGTGEYTTFTSELNSGARECKVTDLEPYTEYEFVVCAENSRGISNNSESATQKTMRIPFEPVEVTAVTNDKDGEVEVSWTAPETNVLAPVKGYNVYYKKTSDTEYTKANVFGLTTDVKYTIINLENGTEYDVIVCAYNTFGEGDASEVQKVTPRKPASAPQNLEKEILSGTSAKLTWNAPADMGGSDLARYEVGIDDGENGLVYSGELTDNKYTFNAPYADIAVTFDGTSAIISGLTMGQKYTFYVRAYTAAKAGADTNVDGTLWKKPSVVQNLDVQPNNEYGQLDVSWEAPADDGGTAVTGYKLSYRLKAENSEWTVIDDIAADAVSYVIENLTNGKEYEVKMVAVNAVGDSDDCEVVEAVPVAKPSTPVIGSISSGNKSAVISTVNVSDIGGTDIIKYHVYAKVSGEDESKYKEINVIESTEQEVKNMTVTGLNNGTKYDIKVTAENAVGETEKSNEETVLAGRPLAPQNLAAAAQAGQKILITFDEADGQGTEIDGYDLYIDGKKTELTDTQYVIDASNKLNGDRFSIYVVSRNAVDTSDPTETIIATVGTPSTPTITNIDVHGTTGVDVTWSESSANGNAMRGYKVYLYDAQDNVYAEFETAADKTTINIPSSGSGYELKDGESYQVRVAGINSVGESVKSDAKVFTLGVPVTPDTPDVEVGNSTLKVSWNKPDDNNSEISAYKIYLNKEEQPTATVTWQKKEEGKYEIFMQDNTVVGSEPVSTGIIQDNLNTFEVEITGLANGVEYTVEVTAINENGESAREDSGSTVTPATVSSSPRNVTATVISGTEAKIAWNAPVYNGGSAVDYYTIDSYKISYKNFETGKYSDLVKTLAKQYTSTTTSVSINDLETGYGYIFEVKAHNSAGLSDLATSSEVRTLTKPDKPVITSVVSAMGKANSLPVTVNWQTPKNDGGSEITGYDIYVNNNYKMNLEGPIPTNQLTYTINDERLNRGSVYSITVVANNKIGSSVSDAKNVAIGAPPAPTGLKASSDTNGNIYISWSSEPYVGMEEYITGFTIFSGSQAIKRTDANVYETQISMRELGTEENIYVIAKGVEGDSEPSETITFNVGAPEAVKDVTVSAAKESVNVSWPKLSDDVTQYIVYVDGVEINTIGDGQTVLTEETYTSAVSKLKGGEEYSIEVAAMNANGIGFKSEAIKVTPWSEPTAPVINKVNSSVGNFSVEFESNTTDGNGLEIKGYNLYLDGVKVNTTVTDAPYVVFTNNKADVHNVTDGVEHSFYITAWTQDGLSNVVESVTPQETYTVVTGVPAAPENLEAIPGISMATLKFDEVADISADIKVTQYEIFQDGEVIKTIPVNDSFTHTGKVSVDINNLVNGRIYQFTVRACNKIGNGTQSYPVNAIPGVPTAPIIEKIDTGDRTINIEWSEPEANSGKIIKYNIYVDGEYAGETTATSYSIDNVVNGHPYIIQLTAYNKIGEGAKSVPSEAMAGKVAGAVGDITSELTYDKSTDTAGIVLKWTEPTDKGGLSITDYNIIGEGEITVDKDNCTATITGLNKGTEYSYTVSAVNAKGTGEETRTDLVKTIDKPDKPEIYGISSENGAITVEWKAPSNNGGSDILGYNVYLEDSETPVNDELITTQPDEDGVMSYTVTNGLETGGRYKVTVKAVNVAGESDGASMTTKVIGEQVITKPSAPRNLTAQSRDKSVALTWKVPVNNGNSPLKYYVVYYGTDENNMSYLKNVIIDGQQTEINAGRVSADVTSLTATGLENGKTYYFTVSAANEAMPALESDKSNIAQATPNKIIAPTVPTWVNFDNTNGVSAYKVNASGNEMTLTWNVSTGDDMYGNISYEVWVNNEQKQTDITIDDGIASCKFGVTSGIEYNVKVVAKNELGGTSENNFIHAFNNLNVVKGKAEDGFTYDEHYKDGIFANIDADYNGTEDYKPEYSKPDMPSKVSCERIGKEQKIKITWSTPKNDGGKTISAYNVYSNGELVKEIAVDGTGAITDADVTFTPNSNGGTYEYVHEVSMYAVYSIQIGAVNEIGENKSTRWNVFITPSTSPSDLQANIAENSRTDIDISWTAPEATVAGYKLYVNGKAVELNKDDYKADGTNISYTYNGEINKEYVFGVSALYSSRPESLISNSVSVSTQETLPMAPQNVEVVVNETDNVSDEYTVSITWNEPENADTANIEYYVIYLNGNKMLGENGEEIHILADDAHEYQYNIMADGTTNGDYFVKVAAVNGLSGTEGIRSDAMMFNIPGDVVSPTAPPKPENVKIDVDRENGILYEGENMHISWTAGQKTDVDQLDATGYNVYINGDKVNDTPVKQSISLFDEGGESTVVFSYEGSPGNDYGVQIEPINDENETVVAGEKSELALASIPENEYPRANADDFAAVLSEDMKKVSLTWTSEDDVVYDLMVHGNVNATNITSPYEYTINDNEVNYVFQLKMTKTYGETAVESYSSTQSISVSRDDKPTQSLPVEISRSISDGLSQAKIFWSAPVKQTDEIGDISGFNVNVEGSEAVFVPISEITQYDEYTYVVKGLDAGDKTVTIDAVKEYDGETFVASTSSSWIMSIRTNIISSEDSFEDNNPEVFDRVTFKDTDGDGTADTPDSKISLTGNISAGGVFANGSIPKLKLTDQYDKTTEYDLVDGDFSIEIPADDGTKVYTAEFYKPGFTKLIINNIKLSELPNVDLSNIKLFAGDINEDGKINSLDITILDSNIFKNIYEISNDLNGDNTVNSLDTGNIYINYGKISNTLNNIK